MTIILSIILFLVLVIAIRVWFVRKEICEVYGKYKQKRKEIKEEHERRQKEQMLYRGIEISRRLSGLTSDELRDPKKIEKAIKGSC